MKAFDTVKLVFLKKLLDLVTYLLNKSFHAYFLVFTVEKLKEKM